MDSLISSQVDLYISWGNTTWRDVIPEVNELLDREQLFKLYGIGGTTDFNQLLHGMKKFWNLLD